ncbi:hypothetical protein C2R22_12395 [Salinigranum rubrum]|uniref:Uncharacterized protein n=1 Tax=Salinigranum rubrum TaxID=755307 RepID=A0A2I8VK95_9EURY|nr:hypothetical protein [Salinigranum rubrum]AUV82341.1 hypothetical protein C2R22_12395 [Salinigranum rubrum]
MTDTDLPDDDTQRLIDRVREELDARSDVERFEVRPADTPGVVATVEGDGGTEHYHVTLERHPDGETKLHWATLGEEPGN